jgi:DNA (cytosine-5)-methyltransferase 1
MLHETDILNQSPRELLAAVRERFSQRELAERLQVVPRTIARWESGAVPIKGVYVGVMRRLLGCDPSRSLSDQKSTEFTFIDLFAGIGGLRLGFESAGGRCVFTCEWDEYAQKAYRANFPHDDHHIVGDIRSVTDPLKQIPKFDVLLAGFPCQPFSIAGVSKKNSLGRPHGFECETQGTLFHDIVRIIEAHQPPAFLLENVKNLRSHDKGRTFRTIMGVLEGQLGYKVSAVVFDVKHLVPQHRERILLAGFKPDVGCDLAALLAQMQNQSHVPISSILHGAGKVAPTGDAGRYTTPDGCPQAKYTLSEKLWQYLKNYKKKHEARGNGFGYGLVKPHDTARTLSARYYKDGSEILVDQGRRQNPRRLTPRECARLMGYADSFKIVVSDTRAYKQFGNSVVVPLIQRVAHYMKPFIMDAVSRREARVHLPSS